ncbi:MAG: hypothetical protein EZS28_035056 [Streblomastix strix]|uniref:Uncharacterized protein n=1 Tax=Streblomastix strix TaxID=222440 RepID=A0A5J4UFJ4_9EUKA|nr:MAG: hypothetical protein EZS28_035056 [Streblomastix strix]
MDGKNISDFVDPDIDAKLAELEAEEEQLLLEEEKLQAAGLLDDFEVEHDHHIPVETPLNQHADRLKILANSKKEKAKIKEKHREIKQKKRQDKQMEKEKEQEKDDNEDGYELLGEAEFQMKKKRRSRLQENQDNDDNNTNEQKGEDNNDNDRGRKRTRRSESQMSIDGKLNSTQQQQQTETSQQRRGRSLSALRLAQLKKQPHRSVSAVRPPPRDASSIRLVNDDIMQGEGFSSKQQKDRSRKMSKIAQHARNKLGKIGDADLHVDNKMPKHLFTGHIKIGKRDRR